jgi:hypothetical protein
MLDARNAILKSINKVELSNEERETITNYANKVAEFAAQELDRLRAQSPLTIICQAMEKYSPTSDGQRPRDKKGEIESIADMANKWLTAVREEHSVDLLQSNLRSREEIIESLFGRRGFDDIIGFPTDATVFITNRPSQADLTSQFLRELGVLPERANVDSLFRLPKHNWNFSSNKASIDLAIQEGRPTRILNGNTIVGLESDLLPGVQFLVSKCGDRLITKVTFTPEAIGRSIPDIS